MGLAWTGAVRRATQVAGERKALLLGGVRVVVAEVDREHALGKRRTHVPGPVVRQIGWAKECIGGAKRVVTNLTGDRPADFLPPHKGGQGERLHRNLGGARRVEA